MDFVVSVIVPVYNAENCIGNCINCLLNQTYRHFELILVNDGSTDASLDVCKKNAGYDERIRVIDKPNGGVSSARNIGLQSASGEFICFVDSDDQVEKNYLKDFVSSYEKNNSEAGYIIHGCVIEYKKNQKCCKSVKIQPKQSTYSVEKYINAIESEVPLITAQSVWGKMYDKSIIDNHCLCFDEKIGLSEDYLFNMLYLNHVNTVVLDSVCNYHYIKTEFETSVHRYHPEYLDTTRRIVELMRNMVDSVSQEMLAYVFREYCRTIYHYYSNYDRSTEFERKEVLKGLNSSPLYKDAIKIKKQPLLYRIIQIVLKQNNLTISDCFFKITSLIRRY